MTTETGMFFVGLLCGGLLGFLAGWVQAFFVMWRYERHRIKEYERQLGEMKS